MPIVLALGNWRQEDQGFKASLLNVSSPFLHVSFTVAEPWETLNTITCVFQLHSPTTTGLLELVPRLRLMSFLVGPNFLQLHSFYVIAI